MCYDCSKILDKNRDKIAENIAGVFSAKFKDQISFPKKIKVPLLVFRARSDARYPTNERMPDLTDAPPCFRIKQAWYERFLIHSRSSLTTILSGLNILISEIPTIISSGILTDNAVLDFLESCSDEVHGNCVAGAKDYYKRLAFECYNLQKYDLAYRMFKIYANGYRSGNQVYANGYDEPKVYLKLGRMVTLKHIEGNDDDVKEHYRPMLDKMFNLYQHQDPDEDDVLTFNQGVQALKRIYEQKCGPISTRIIDELLGERGEGAAETFRAMLGLEE